MTNDPMSREKVAEYFGITASGVAIIERQALEKCRRLLRFYGYTPEHFFSATASNDELVNDAARQIEAPQFYQP